MHREGSLKLWRDVEESLHPIGSVMQTPQGRHFALDDVLDYRF